VLLKSEIAISDLRFITIASRWQLKSQRRSLDSHWPLEIVHKMLGVDFGELLSLRLRHLEAASERSIDIRRRGLPPESD